MSAAPTNAGLHAFRALAAFVLSVACLFPSGAQAQTREPVRLEVEGVFGNALVNQGHGTALVVRATNQRAIDRHGELVVSSGWREQKREFRQRLDLPRGETRTAIIEVEHTNGSIRVEYVADGSKLGSSNLSGNHRGRPNAVVVIADPSTLRGQLIDLDVEIDSRALTLDIGGVSEHPTSGDLVLPRRPSGWGGVSLVVVTTRMLKRIRGTERAALLSWVRNGGRVLIFPREVGELADESLTDFIPPVTAGPAQGARGSTHFVPREAQAIELVGRGVTPAVFGGIAQIGFGSVYIATYNGCDAPFVSDPAPRALIRSIASVAMSGPAVAVYGNDPGFSSRFDNLRRALDPNESYRPALLAVAVVLFLYVLLVGPLNFAFIGRRGRPMLALVTTPILAISCMLTLLLVGYVGKGVKMRYRGVQVDEYVAGETRGTSARYLGLFTTRPITVESPVPRFGDVRMRHTAQQPTISVGPEGRVAGPISGGLWETLFVRRLSEVELSGPIRFGREEVVNDSSIDLAGAIVVRDQSILPVGRVPAGSRAAVGSEGMRVSFSSLWGTENLEFIELAGHLGLPEEHHALLLGVVQMVPRPGDFIFAWYEAEEEQELGVYAPEKVVRFLRLESPTSPNLTFRAEASR